jgi:hypothetical protein
VNYARIGSEICFSSSTRDARDARCCSGHRQNERRRHRVLGARLVNRLSEPASAIATDATATTAANAFGL